ncbi:MAG TPA: UDP-N-acetylglucosamine 2-epimerase [Coriobacteriia bacterium]|nr:UDP-N-acetylglucosamine 2-epimerase [Coriobacteriia bacterium]
MSVKVTVVTTGRADYGLLRPLLVVLREDDRFQLDVLATGSHLVAEQGMTVDAIVADGFEVAHRIALPAEGDDRLATAHATGEGIRLIADALDVASPDIVVILGDRFEAFAAASAATILDIPVAHIHGGELTFGSLDDAFRHAITKLSTLHFASTEVYRKRIVQMGEPAIGVFNTGALAVDNVRGTELLDEDEFESVHGVVCDGSTLLVTFHPVTRGGESLGELYELLAALDAVPEFRVLFTAPNLDAGGRAVRSAIESWVEANAARADLVTVLGWRGYLSATKNCAAVVGNSSSGLIEVPALGVPSIDIGHRQSGRLRPAAVVHAQADRDSIAAAIRHATSPLHREVAATASNPYGDGHAAAKIADVLADSALLARVQSAGFTDIDY